MISKKGFKLNIAVINHFCSSSFKGLFVTENSGKEYDNTVIDIASEDNWMEKSANNTKEYCDLHGYEFFLKKYQEMPTERSISWYGLDVLSDILNDNPKNSIDWIMYADLDVLFMRDEVLLEDIIEKAESLGKKAIFPNQKRAYVSSYKTGEIVTAKNAVCAGAFFIKKCEWSKRLIERIWSFPYESPKHISILHDKHVEQDCFNIFMSENIMSLEENSLLMPNRVFNSFSHWNTEGEIDLIRYQDGDFIIHLAGLNREQREALVEEHLHRKSNPDKSTWTDIPDSLLRNGVTWQQLKPRLEATKKVREKIEVDKQKDLQAKAQKSQGTLRRKKKK